MSLKTLVDELVSLNDKNLAQRVIDNDDVQWCLSELQDILAADVEPVVRCGDCVFARESDSNRMRGRVVNCGLYASRPIMCCNDFCSYGKRKKKESHNVEPV